MTATLAVLATLVLAGAGVVVWQRSARARSDRRNVLYVYRHVDEILGAKKAEAERAAKARDACSFWLGWWPALARLLVLLYWRTPNATVRWPPHRRRARYVQLTYGTWRDGRVHPPPAAGQLHLHHVHAVTLHWSTEAVANHDKFEEACERGRGGIGVGAGAAGLAQALGLQWREGLFDRTRDDAGHRITFTRVHALEVPDRFDLAEEANGAQ